jgi:predicted membrane channel-forming protein YqfA (hemolysin III family)
MTESQTAPGSSTTVQRRIGWFSIAAAIASLAVTIADRMTGGHVRWTAWALPLLIAGNAAAFFLGAFNRRPRLVPVFVFLSLALAAAIIMAEALALVHR